ncbi:hypothetical protein MW887_000577 [Aspergillus wentii]|nr:hypothetical protein MW887_000577 [Aspergillus wentii]
MDSPVDYCCVCTAILDYEFGADLALAERPEWHSRTVSAPCSIETFRKWYFKTPWLWGTFVRLIIDNATRKDIKVQLEPRFQISGVFQEGNWSLPGEYRDIVPRDADIVMVGNPLTRNRKEMIPVFGVGVLYQDVSFQDFPYQKPHLWPLGYKIHERCWGLSLRVFGSANMERHLDLFIEAVRQRSRVIMSKRHPWVMLRSEGRIYETAYKELFVFGKVNEIKTFAIIR